MWTATWMAANKRFTQWLCTRFTHLCTLRSRSACKTTWNYGILRILRLSFPIACLPWLKTFLYVSEIVCSFPRNLNLGDIKVLRQKLYSRSAANRHRTIYISPSIQVVCLPCYILIHCTFGHSIFRAVAHSFRATLVNCSSVTCKNVFAFRVR